MAEARAAERPGPTSVTVLLTNDDGIDAPGLAALEAALAGFAETRVVAPHEHLSGCSHQVSNGRPLEVTSTAAHRYAVNGTPADCTRLGLLHLAPESHWVMAGINDGGNLGVDVYMSGTVAAAREAALLGKPAIAFSQYRRSPRQSDFSHSSKLVHAVLARLWKRPIPPGAFWNVNFPDPADCSSEPEVVFCPLETAHLPVRYDVREGRFHYCGRYHERPRSPGSDVDVCFSGQVAVTLVTLDGRLPPPPA